MLAWQHLELQSDREFWLSIPNMRPFLSRNGVFAFALPKEHRPAALMTTLTEACSELQLPPYEYEQLFHRYGANVRLSNKMDLARAIHLDSSRWMGVSTEYAVDQAREEYGAN